jgi:hypothetical protein
MNIEILLGSKHGHFVIAFYLAYNMNCLVQKLGVAEEGSYFVL